MKKIALIATACAFSLALAACGGSGDASEDAMADSVELPADEAMSDVPDPGAAAVADAAEDATKTAEESVDTAEAAGDAAAAAAADAQSAADAAAAAAAN